ncbi:xanthine dehydrogenase [Paenibacillus montaniterrae]|uniref:Xanthine dehydrogenase n=1 Tax=Paenibacillus montaniterrae TaxID=429341 RepID=A0A919YQZ5_9BACL|nr:XdhC/CoxI family protein [Paenibacillus montaniterrae]GIP15746.1 xanthine dehydrogenase [Paenibacillus montaniterrae]
MDAYDVLRLASTSAEPTVLATIVGVEGHAYRKTGAMMLLTEGGATIGSLSPGCLETDLQLRVSSLLKSGDYEIITYNMVPEEDAVWGDAIGCGGKLRILLEPIAGLLRELLGTAYSLIEKGETVRLLRYGFGDGMRYDLKSIDGLANIQNGHEDEELVFEQTFLPKPRLLLFGAGQDLDPLYRLAGRIGFRMAVADWREELVNAARFPNAELAVGSAADIVAALCIQSSDYAIVCSHQLRKDREMLELLLAIEPIYLGVIGSRKRIAHLFEGLPRPSFVHAPVGLAIGGEGPEEIAVSIVAELIAVRSRSLIRKGADGAYALDRHLLGCRTEPKDGETQAIFGACRR